MCFFRLFSVLLLIILNACRLIQDIPIAVEPAHIINKNAQKFLIQKKYKKSADKFLDLERLYPYSKYTKKGLLLAIKSYFKINEYDNVISVSNRYIRLYPHSNDIKIIYYLRAESYYIRIADSKRDQNITLNAQKYLKKIIKKFPFSNESVVAANKLLIINNLLAAKELEIGRYYLNKHNFIAAINRFKNVIIKYQKTKQVEESIARLVEAYLTLGLRDEAKANILMLGRKYPSSEWYNYVYNLFNKLK